MRRTMLGALDLSRLSGHQDPTRSPGRLRISDGFLLCRRSKFLGRRKEKWVSRDNSTLGLINSTKKLPRQVNTEVKLQGKTGSLPQLDRHHSFQQAVMQIQENVAVLNNPPRRPSPEPVLLKLLIST